MDGLLAKRTLLKRKLTRIKTKIDAQPDIHTVKVQEEQIALLYTEFNELFDEIISTCPTDEDGIHQDQYDEIAERFDEAKVAIRRILHQLNGMSPSISNQRPIRETAHVQNDVMVKLPKLDIPTFSGNILEWTSFCDLFTSSIHDHPTLKGSQKLKYLKNAVTGEAADLIADITISDANYNEAWEMLNKRYNNERKLISSHLTRLLEMPYLKSESGSDLRKLVDTASSVIRAMKALERPLGDNCDLAMLLISNRLDVETHKLWESKLGRDTMPKLSELVEFLDERAAILYSSEFGKQKAATIISSKQNGMNNNKKATVHQTTTDNACLVCNKAIHPIYSCPEFLELTVPDRRAKVKKLSLCFNCMRNGHTSQKCFSESTCKKCEGKHNTLLHLDTPTVVEKSVTAIVSAHMAVIAGDAKRALLSTALVNVIDAFGKKQVYRALIDPGADVSFVSERCVQMLGIAREYSSVGFNGLRSKSVGRSRGFVNLTVGSRYDANFQIDVNAYVMIKVTGTLPRLPCSKEEIGSYKDMQLADPFFHKPGQVDLLLGSDIFFSILRLGQRSAGEGLPGALNTVLGWIIGGECPSQTFISATVHHIQCEENLDEILMKFWETEEILNKPLLTSDEKNCEKHFLSTTIRDSDGRFVVELPFKEGHIPLGNSGVLQFKD